MVFTRKYGIIVMTLISLVSIVGCSNGGKEGDDVPVNGNKDYGKLVIEDIDIYYGNKHDFLSIEFTKPEYKSEIKYEFTGNLISFEGDAVKQEKNGVRTVEVKATTKYHETKFNVNLHNQPEHASDISYFALDRKSRNLETGQIIFAGDSFFDPRYDNTWHNFYEDVEGIDLQVFASGSAGSKIEEWRGLAMKMLYTPAPKHIVMNCGSNDFYDKGYTLEDTIINFKALIKDIHKHLPDTAIYYFTMINRDNPIPSKTKEYTLEVINGFNNAIKEEAKNDSLLKICDITNHFMNADGSAISSLLKDGCHPKDSEFKVFVEEAIKQGAPIRYIGGTN